MTVSLPTIGTRLWGLALNAALSSIDARLASLETGNILTRLAAVEANAGTLGLGTRLSAVEALAAAAVPKGSAYISVKDKGAVGNGVANDSTAVNTAATAAGANGTVYFPPGTYMIDSLTLSAAGQRWSLDPSATLKLRPSTNAAALIITGANFTIEGGTVDGNGASQTSGPNLVTVAASGVTLRRLSVKNAFANGIVFANVDNLTFDGIYSSGCGLSAFLGSNYSRATTGLRVLNCVVDQSAQSVSATLNPGICIHGTTSFPFKDAQVSNCRVTMPVSSTYGQAICIETWYCPGVAITGNVTRGGYMGISSVCTGASITGNTVTAAYRYGIEVPSSPQATVGGNTIDGTGVTWYGIAFDGTGSNSGSVTGNSVVGCVKNSVQVYNATNVAVTGNSLIGTTSWSVSFQSCQGVTVAGNTIDGSGTGQKGVAFDTCTKMTVSGNVIRNFTESGVLFYSASTSFSVGNGAVTGNTFISVTNPLDWAFANGAGFASTIRVSGNDGCADYLDLGNKIRHSSGNGSPEGAVTAGRGSTYVQLDGTAGSSCFWVKQTGTTATGWVSK